MSFGRNPHVAKAEAAEQKAQCAKDVSACEQAWREAARMWERAAERETHDGRRQQYAEKAEAARANADNPQLEGGAAAEANAEADGRAAPGKTSTLLN
ncbi:MAG: hypothetical protein MUF34_25600 [Polyangiaceae bacterium]|nr:hypothetical protein [Polyangiaceae bacterium]